MVKYVCYDILELEMYGYHIYCNKSYICSTCTTFTILGRVWNLGEGPAVGSRVERGAQIGGKGIIAFRGRVRTNTTEVSTGWKIWIFMDFYFVIFRSTSFYLQKHYPFQKVSERPFEDHSLLSVLVLWWKWEHCYMYLYTCQRKS